MVVALQGYNTLAIWFHPLGPLVALSVVRELGPVVCIIICRTRRFSDGC